MTQCGAIPDGPSSAGRSRLRSGAAGLHRDRPPAMEWPPERAMVARVRWRPSGATGPGRSPRTC